MGRTLRWWILVPLVMWLVACSSPDAATYASETTSATTNPADGDTPLHDLIRGKNVFSSYCMRCHGEGRYDAPQLGNAADWEPRLRQPLATLIRHAINGHGRMPPKGGFSVLSNDEVSDAVTYVVDRSRKIVLALKDRQHEQECHPLRAPEKCGPMAADDVLVLQMLWLLGAPNRH